MVAFIDRICMGPMQGPNGLDNMVVFERFLSQEAVAKLALVDWGHIEEIL